MLSLESGVVVGSVAITVSIIALVGKNLSRKFDEKADRDVVESRFKTSDERFKEMNERINHKADREVTERIFKTLDRIDEKITNLSNK